MKRRYKRRKGKNEDEIEKEKTNFAGDNSNLWFCHIIACQNLNEKKKKVNWMSF